MSRRCLNLNCQAWSLLLTALLGVVHQAAAKTLVEMDVPRFGHVRVDSILTPGRGPVIRFVDAQRRTLLEFPLGEDGPADSPMAPRIAARIQAMPSSNQPLVVVAVANPHGSAVIYYVAAVGVAGEKLALLHPPWSVTDSGGVFVGDLGPGNGWGVATWDFIWDSCHACANRRQVRLYAWSGRGQFDLSPTKVLLSAHRYKDSMPALAELGLHYSNMLATIPEFQGL